MSRQMPFDAAIYRLQDALGVVKYIGITTRYSWQNAEMLRHRRFVCHRNAKTALGEWIRRTPSVVMDIIEIVVFNQTYYPYERERFWINEYRSRGADLFNIYPLIRPKAYAPIPELTQ